MPSRSHSDDLQLRGFQDPSLFLNRELSLLEFNRRVVTLSLDEAVPLLERLRFLTISCTNLDEFFEIRAASHKERAAFRAEKVSIDGQTSQQVLCSIKRSASALVDEQYRALNDVLLPALERESIRLLREDQCSKSRRRWLAEYFRAEVFPVLTPVGLDPAHPFPRILNKSLNVIVMLEGDDAFGRDTNIAIVQVPRTLPRVIQLPASAGTADDYVLLSAVIDTHIAELFPGLRVIGCHQFRVTRNGELWVDEEEVDDILLALKGELPERHYSEPVRLEVSGECPDAVARFLLSKFGLGEDDLYRVAGPVNVNRLGALYDLVDRPDLKYEPFRARFPRRLQRGADIFEAIREADVLLHHPYESFQPIIELLRTAASDPKVLAIKQTLYRAGSQSPVVSALIDAARAGKDVTVVIELRARFDEAENIDLATQLQDVGANVVYGVVGYKTHSKMLLIVRREGAGLRRYVHLSTGNYHSGTARAYTDLGLLTARRDFGEDVHRLFSQLTGVGHVVELSQLWQSPFTLHRALLDRIGGLAAQAREGIPCRIVAKLNALTESKVIRALYAASAAGVRIDLIVRGACCLRPGVPGVSDKIRVRSVLGRFLEHSRIYYFETDGVGDVFLASADWMSRNLVRRVETCFPILDPAIARRVRSEDLENYLGQEVRCWELREDGRYERRPPLGCAWVDAQTELLHRLCDDGQRDVESIEFESGAREPTRKSTRNGHERKSKRDGRERTAKADAPGKPKKHK